MFAGADRSALPVVYALDATAGPAADEVVWSAAAVLDDDGAMLDTADGGLRWRAWLYWANLLQFLDAGGGSGVQLVASRAGEFPVDALAVGREPRSAAPAPEPTTAVDGAWTEVLETLEPDEAPLRRIAELLAARGKAAPVFGHELGEHAWQIDFGWPDVRAGVLLSVEAHSEEGRRRDAAYAAAGWTVRSVQDWLADLESLLDLLPDGEGTTR